MSLINTSKDKAPEVPRVEVHGEEVVINRPNPNNPDEGAEEHKKLPKNKWF